VYFVNLKLADTALYNGGCRR